MPPPSTSTKPRVELGELRRTQTMPSAIASPRLRPILFPLTLLSCPVLWRVQPPGPPVIPRARQALKRSKPSLAGLSHARYPTTMMIMRSVRCGGENELRGGRHKKRIFLNVQACQNVKTKWKVKPWCFFSITWKGNPSIFCLLDGIVFRLEIS